MSVNMTVVRRRSGVSDRRGIGGKCRLPGLGWQG
jgi:hypothetical protein